MAKKRMTTREYLRALFRVGLTSFQIAPSAAIVRIADSIIQAGLPIVTTYFAALTTSALTAAYGGDKVAAKQVFLYIVITAGLSIVTLLWGSVNNYLSQKTRYKVESSVEDQMLEKFMSLPFYLYDDKETVDLHEKANRFSWFFGYIFNTIGDMLTSVIGAIGALVALAFLSPTLALVVLVAVTPGIIIQIRLVRQQTQHWAGNITNRRRKGNLGWMLHDSRYIAEMRVYGVVRKLIKYHAELRDRDEKERLEMELKVVWKQLVANVLEAVVELGALIWIVLQIINRAQPVGQFLYVQQMVSRVIGEMKNLASQLSRVDEDLANIVDYQRFMELSAADVGTKPIAALRKQITFEHVSFRYPKTKTEVLRDVSLTVSAGQHVAIVGENGAGKSTLIKLLMGLYQPTEGKVLIDGVDLKDIDPDTWHGQIAMLGQDFLNYYFATIKENIEYGDVTRPYDEAKMTQALKDAEFYDTVSKLEHKENTFIERWMAEDNDEATAIELSGGQYQRLALARNFYRDSQIMVLDEPTSAIDALAESRIFGRLFKSDRTIITISHRLTTIEKADIIYMLKDGELVERGTYQELVEQNGEFVRMFKSQIK